MTKNIVSRQKRVFARNTYSTNNIEKDEEYMDQSVMKFASA